MKIITILPLLALALAGCANNSLWSHDASYDREKNRVEDIAQGAEAAKQPGTFERIWINKSMTPEERADKIKRKYGATCEALGFTVDSNDYRKCMVDLYTANQGQ